MKKNSAPIFNGGTPQTVSKPHPGNLHAGKFHVGGGVPFKDQPMVGHVPEGCDCTKGAYKMPDQHK